jgi:hypothetical protein
MLSQLDGNLGFREPGFARHLQRLSTRKILYEP